MKFEKAILGCIGAFLEQGQTAAAEAEVLVGFESGEMGLALSLTAVVVSATRGICWVALP